MSINLKRVKYRYNYLGNDIEKLKMIGQGHEGQVFLLPNDKVLKVFHNPEACKRQIEILSRARDSRFFPTVYDFDSYSILMSLVHGRTLSYHFKNSHIDKHLSHELVKLIKEFKRLQFTKLDMRLGHIFLQPDKTIKVIDPRNSYNINLSYPRSMLKGLRKYGVLNDFLKYIKHDYPDYYNQWKSM